MQDIKDILLSPETSQMLAESHKPLIIEIGNTTIVGELHIKTSSDPEIEKDFSQKINEVEFVVLEHKPLANDPYSQQSTAKRFMAQAYEHAIESGKQMTTLDEEFSVSDRYNIWLNAGVDISRDNYHLLGGIHLLRDGFMSNTDQATLLNNLFGYYKYFLKDESYANKMTIGTFKCFTEQNNIVEQIEEQTNLLLDYINVDATAREIYYQQRIAGISKNVGDRKMMVVVGKYHVRPIFDTLTNGSISKIDQSKVDRINSSLSSIRAKYDLD